MKQKIKKIIESKNYSRIKISIIFVMFLFTVSLGTACFSYFYTNGSYSSGSENITILGFDPRVNSSSENTQAVNLSSTITNNKSFAPGAEGKFKIDLDFSNVDYDSYYKVSVDRTGVPNNVKFYVDEDYTTEFDYIEGVAHDDYSNQVVEHYVYWKWVVDNSPQSNANDNLYMGQEINVEFTTYVSQIVEKETVFANDIQESTGRIDLVSTHAGNNKGSFNIRLNSSNATANSQYRVYFNEKELSSNLHLYSDSSYQNEINYIQGTFTGYNNNVTNTVYWKLDSGSVSSLSNGLYYVVVFGSW